MLADCAVVLGHNRIVHGTRRYLGVHIWNLAAVNTVSNVRIRTGIFRGGEAKISIDIEVEVGVTWTTELGSDFLGHGVRDVSTLDTLHPKIIPDVWVGAFTVIGIDRRTEDVGVSGGIAGNTCCIRRYDEVDRYCCGSSADCDIIAVRGTDA